MGLHKVLVNMLTEIGDEYQLQSWAIFHEKNGSLTVKVRLDEGGNSLKRESTAFKKKSSGQLKRDKHRSEQWRQQKPSMSADHSQQQQHHVRSDLPLKRLL